MRFSYGKQDLQKHYPMDSTCYLLTNGLGGYSSVSAAFSVNRCDAGILIGAQVSPNVRNTLVHGLKEQLSVGGAVNLLSGQIFQEGRENGWEHLESFCFDGLPCWNYSLPEADVQRRISVVHMENTACVFYKVDNRASFPARLTVTPLFKPNAKDRCLESPLPLSWEDGFVRAGDFQVFIRTNGEMSSLPAVWSALAYPEDEKDGRPGKGLAGACGSVRFSVPANTCREFYIMFSDRTVTWDPWKLEAMERERQNKLREHAGFSDPITQQLVVSSDCFISRRDSTRGKTILAGYPLFSDWGRDTMIALVGCCLTAKRYEDAKSILESFAQYEKDGLLPNLFPEGSQTPMYNSVDSPLLFIDCLWQYYRRTGDGEFIRQVYPRAESIIAHFRTGTRHAIRMDGDGLIRAGEGLDQVTWMDVSIDGILPTPRHGKPVEVNAYWYSALMVMDRLAQELALPRKDYAALACQVKASFLREFYLPRQGYLKDVVSGVPGDEQIRCNQIWAVSASFSMLSREQAVRVVDTVYHHLYTDAGLRSLSPSDPQFKPVYGGSQFRRDMAYHQGTVWVFPLGAWYRSYLKVHDNSREAALQVKQWLSSMEERLKEGCAGQLPEIYDGLDPKESKGCFAQAWSVGEMLRVCELLEEILQGKS